MAAYPLSPMWGYPLVRTLEFKTEIATGENGTEQRWALTTGEERWTLTYPRLTLAQRDTLISAFDAAKGSFDQTLTFDFDGATFADVHFDSDRFSAVESRLGQWTVSVTLRQVVRGADSGTLAADFPVLLTGARVQLPYTAERSFDNVTARTEGGRFAWYKRATPLRTWTAGGSVIDGNEAQAIFDQFRLAAGRLKTFQFTDPDSLVAYPNCRFASDMIEWRYISKNINEIRVQIQQFA
jgi:hypothetical protein